MGAYGRALVFERLTSSHQTTDQAEFSCQEAGPPGERPQTPVPTGHRHQPKWMPLMPLGPPGAHRCTA